MTEEREKDIRFLMWQTAREAITGAANDLQLPNLTPEEAAYAKEFLIGIAKVTKPGGYVEPDDDDDGNWCSICGEDTGLESHYHCYKCGEICSMQGHGTCPS